MDNHPKIDAMLATLGFELVIKSGPNPHNVDDWMAVAYSVELRRRDRLVIATDYKLGLGHVNIKRRVALVLDTDERRLLEQWRDKPYAKFLNPDLHLQVACKVARATKLAPTLRDVVWSLLMDGSPFFHAETFQDWAENLGYSSDSIKAKASYDVCLETGMAFANTLTTEQLEQLQDVYQDF